MLQTARQDSRPKRGHELVAVSAEAARPERYVSRTLALGLAGSLLLWAAFPPLNLPWLAWIAPVPWLWLVREPRLAGRLPYVALWLAGFVHWLLMLEGIRLAHPALYAGWIALAAYLGVYLPVFVGLSRVAMQRLRMSLVVAAPSRLGRPGAAPRPSHHRILDGPARPHAGGVSAPDSDFRSGRRLHAELRHHARRRVPDAHVLRGWLWGGQRTTALAPIALVAARSGGSSRSQRRSSTATGVCRKHRPA